MSMSVLEMIFKLELLLADGSVDPDVKVLASIFRNYLEIYNVE